MVVVNSFLFFFMGVGEHQPDLAEFETALQSICPGAKPYDPIWLSAFRLHRRNVARYNVGKVGM